MTNGKAVPSLRPASPVRPKRSRSRSAGRATCTSRGEHRVGGREDRAEQDRRAERQAEPETPASRDQRDGQHHRDVASRSGSSQRRSPRAVRSLSPAVNSETSTATSVSRSSSAASRSGSSAQEPRRPAAPSATPTRQVEHRGR